MDDDQEPTDEVAALAVRLHDGDVRAAARLISLIENGSPVMRAATPLLRPRGAGTRIIGLTGAPGVGKSTTTSGIVAEYRTRGRRVGVLAIDPSSPFSGGAVLGDRIRMHDHATDPGVFIRSMANRGHQGGLAWAAPQALRVLAALGCDVVVVETVGIGQAEVEVAGIADTTLVLLAPGGGDRMQAAKAGLMEIADVFVVNKADRDGAAVLVRDLRLVVGQGDTPDAREGPVWRPPVLTAVASRGDGISEIVDQIERHADWLAVSGTALHRRRARALGEVEAIAVAALRDRLAELRAQDVDDGLADRLLSGEVDPFAAAEAMLAALA